MRYLTVYLGCITIREKVAINFLKFFDTEMATRAILKKSLIPFLNFGV